MAQSPTRSLPSMGQLGTLAAQFTVAGGSGTAARYLASRRSRLSCGLGLRPSFNAIGCELRSPLGFVSCLLFAAWTEVGDRDDVDTQRFEQVALIPASAPTSFQRLAGLALLAVFQNCSRFMNSELAKRLRGFARHVGCVASDSLSQAVFVAFKQWCHGTHARNTTQSA